MSLLYNNGDIFEGEFENEERNGHGIIKYFNGDIFEGEFKNDERNGHAIFKGKEDMCLKVN